MRHLILGTAGHVDHGKTALVKALTDIDCDTHEEEKRRGITINLGFSHLELPDGSAIGIVDVPGHKDFIRTMVAGAYGIDIALLVIAADSGIMPQTVEHMRIIEMLGVEHGIVALTKADLVDEETLELAELEVTEFLEGTTLENAPVICVSSVTGQGLEELVSTIGIMAAGISERKSGDTFRMYIDRIFNVKGIGYVVTGSVLEGTVSTGADLFLLPGKSKKVKVRQIQRHGLNVDAVFQGDRAALNLSGLKLDDYSRGMVLSNRILDDSPMVDAMIEIFDPEIVLGIWSKVLFISGTFETSARLHLLDADELNNGETGLAQLEFSKPAILSPNDKFILRNSSNDRTLGGGTIMDSSPLHHRKRTDKLIGELKALAEATMNSNDIVSLVMFELNKVNAPVFAEDLGGMMKIPAGKIIEEVKAKGHGSFFIYEEKGKNILITGETEKHYQDQVVEELALHHSKFPILETGLDTNELSGKLGFTRSEAGKLFLDVLLDKMLREGQLKQSGNTWTLPGHKVVIDARTKADLEWIEQLYSRIGMDVPNPKLIDEKIHGRRLNKDRFKMLQNYLRDQGSLVCYDGVFIHGEIAEEVHRKLLLRIGAKEDGINEKEFREMVSGTRRFIQVLLGLFIEWGTVTKPTFFILITEKGKKLIE